MRIVNRNRVAKQSDGKFHLSPSERETVKAVVADCRAEVDGPMSPPMRLVADELAQEILAEEHGIVVSLARIRRVA
jgi:hypothetical protein